MSLHSYFKVISKSPEYTCNLHLLARVNYAQSLCCLWTKYNTTVSGKPYLFPTCSRQYQQQQSIFLSHSRIPKCHWSHCWNAFIKFIIPSSKDPYIYQKRKHTYSITTQVMSNTQWLIISVMAKSAVHSTKSRPPEVMSNRHLWRRLLSVICVIPMLLVDSVQ